MALTAELVAQVERMERDTGPEPGLTRLAEEDYHGIAELGYREDVPATRWINVRTDAGKVRALAFYAGPRGSDYAGRRSPEEVACILASAAGHMGSCARYRYQTVMKPEEHGAHDRRLWHLQELVARNIELMAESGDLH